MKLFGILILVAILWAAVVTISLRHAYKHPKYMTEDQKNDSLNFFIFGLFAVEAVTMFTYALMGG